MKQLVKVHMLPTDKSSIYLHQGKLYNNKVTMHIPDGKQIPQHLYLTSDEEIKEGDWCIHTSHGKSILIQVKYIENKGQHIITECGQNCWGDYCRKIVATTDKVLGFGNGYHGWYPLPQIPQQFIEEYCKVGGIDEVLIKYGFIEKINKVPIWKLKLDSNNCVIISSVKESWNREEIEALLVKYWRESDGKNGIAMTNWIKENLK